jgi:hypothetical protein
LELRGKGLACDFRDASSQTFWANFITPCKTQHRYSNLFI